MKTEGLSINLATVREQYGFKEQGLMVARLVKSHMDSLPIWHFADAIGDTGAAAGICQLVGAFHAFAKGYAPGHLALCCTCAVRGGRAAAVVQREGIP